MGLILDRNVMHWRYDRDTAIVDLCFRMKPSLAVIDAFRVLSTNGPYGPGKVLTPGEIIASADPVAADAMMVASHQWYGHRIPPRQVAQYRPGSSKRVRTYRHREYVPPAAQPLEERRGIPYVRHIEKICTGCLILFALLLGTAESGTFFGLRSDVFLRLDPLVGTAVPLPLRAVVPALFPAAFIILLAVLDGHIFCGWLCPMGTTLDGIGSIARRILRSGKTERRHTSDPAPRSLKYLVLAAILTAALCGVNLAFWASPIPLATRLYALVLHPLGREGIDQGMEVVSPLLERLGAVDWLYWHADSRHFHTAWFVALLWLVLAALECVRPRFWCRYLCPAGALLGLFSRVPFWRRRVSANGTSCGRCSARCPPGILEGAPMLSQPSECLTCRACVSACKHKATHFDVAHSVSTYSSPHQPNFPSRRAFCASLAAGVMLAGISRIDSSR